jgi:hypothetical protein
VSDHENNIPRRKDLFSVIAQASCRIIKPKDSRGSEGTIRVHIDMSKIPLMNLDNWKLVENFELFDLIFSIKTSGICTRIKWYSGTKYSPFELY